MKRKIFQILIGIILIVVPKSVANAAITNETQVNNCLQYACTQACSSDIYSYEESRNTCINKCIENNTALSNSCGCTTSTPSNCYSKVLCANKAYEGSELCKSASQRNSITNETCVTACRKISSCNAPFWTGKESCENICLGALSSSDCFSEDCFTNELNELCNKPSGNTNNERCSDACEKIESDYNLLDSSWYKHSSCTEVCYSLQLQDKCDDSTNCYRDKICSEKPEWCKSNESTSGGKSDEGSNSDNGGSSYNPDKMNAANCYGFGDTVYYATLVVSILRIAAPILLILWASIDLLRSIISGDEKKIVAMRKPIITRFISAILVFLVPWIVSSIVNSFSSDADWITCWKNNSVSHEEAKDQAASSYEKDAIEDACKKVCKGVGSQKECVRDCGNAYNGSSEKCETYASLSCYDTWAGNWFVTNMSNYK